MNARASKRPAFARLLPLPLLVALLLACCPVPTAATETAFAARVESVALPYASVTLADGRPLRLSLGEAPPPGFAPGARVYVEGVFGDDLVVVRRLALL